MAEDAQDGRYYKCNAKNSFLDMEQGGSYTKVTLSQGLYQYIETKWPPFADDIFKYVFVTENIRILVKISLFVGI